MIFFLFILKPDFFFKEPLGSVVTFTASTCLYYIFGNCGHARSQGGRQPAEAEPPSYYRIVSKFCFSAPSICCFILMRTSSRSSVGVSPPISASKTIQQLLRGLSGSGRARRQSYSRISVRLLLYLSGCYETPTKETSRLRLSGKQEIQEALHCEVSVYNKPFPKYEICQSFMCAGAGGPAAGLANPPRPTHCSFGGRGPTRTETK